MTVVVVMLNVTSFSIMASRRRRPRHRLGRSAFSRRWARWVLPVLSAATVVLVAALFIERPVDVGGSGAASSVTGGLTAVRGAADAHGPAHDGRRDAAEPEPTVAPVVPDWQRCPDRARACVDLDAQRAWLQRDGAVSYGPVPIQGGSRSAPTPTGTFTVLWKDRDHVSGEFGVPMPYAVFFAAGGIAFHQGSLTDPSHGCIHLAEPHAAVFFARLQPSDIVVVF